MPSMGRGVSRGRMPPPGDYLAHLQQLKWQRWSSHLSSLGLAILLHFHSPPAERHKKSCCCSCWINSCKVQMPMAGTSKVLCTRGIPEVEKDAGNDRALTAVCSPRDPVFHAASIHSQYSLLQILLWDGEAANTVDCGQ